MDLEMVLLAKEFRSEEAEFLHGFEFDQIDWLITEVERLKEKYEKEFLEDSQRVGAVTIPGKEGGCPSWRPWAPAMKEATVEGKLYKEVKAGTTCEGCIAERQPDLCILLPVCYNSIFILTTRYRGGPVC